MFAIFRKGKPLYLSARLFKWQFCFSIAAKFTLPNISIFAHAHTEKYYSYFPGFFVRCASRFYSLFFFFKQQQRKRKKEQRSLCSYLCCSLCVVVELKPNCCCLTIRVCLNVVSVVPTVASAIAAAMVPCKSNPKYYKTKPI
jgi:hypothetical protein